MSVRQFGKIAIVSLLVLSGAARAEQQVDPKALAKAQSMLRQVSTERDSLQTENAQLKADLAALKAKKSSTDGALVKSKESLREIQENLDRTVAEKKMAEEEAAERGRRIEQCSVKNAKLHELNSELLQRYANKGVVDAMVRREPFTGIKKVQLENLIQDLQDKIDAQRVSPSDAAARAVDEAGQPIGAQ